MTLYLRQNASKIERVEYVFIFMQEKEQHQQN